jgi:peptidase YpeB-like protein
MAHRDAEGHSGGREARPFFAKTFLTAPQPIYKVCHAAKECGAAKQAGNIDVTHATPIRRTRRALAAVAAASLATALGFVGDIAAQPPAGHPPPGGSSLAPASPFQAQLPQRRQLTLAEAIQLAQSRYPGRVVRAQTIQQGNGAVHEIRIIGNDGRVHTVTVDARTGAVH